MILQYKWKKPKPTSDQTGAGDTEGGYSDVQFLDPRAGQSEACVLEGCGKSRKKKGEDCV